MQVDVLDFVLLLWRGENGFEASTELSGHSATRGCIALEFSINIKVKLIALNKNDIITMT